MEKISANSSNSAVFTWRSYRIKDTEVISKNNMKHRRGHSASPYNQVLVMIMFMGRTLYMLRKIKYLILND